MLVCERYKTLYSVCIKIQMQKKVANLLKFLPIRCSPRIKSSRKTGQVEANNRSDAAYQMERGSSKKRRQSFRNEQDLHC